MKMKKSTDKKLIVIKNKDLIDKMLDDIEEVTSLNSSALIESFIIKSILPSNKSAECWIRFMYEYDWKSNEVLDAAYSYLSGGINWKAKYTNALPLVKFSYELDYHSQTTLGDAKNEIHYIISQLDSIRNFLKYNYENIPDNDELKKCNLEEEIQLLSQYIKDAENEPSMVTISNIYMFIINNWEFLNDYTKTYRLLSVLESIRNDINDTASIRYRLINILKAVSNEWND